LKEIIFQYFALFSHVTYASTKAALKYKNFRLLVAFLDFQRDYTNRNDI